MIVHKHQQRHRRHARVRARVHGTAARPRLSIFRSLRMITAQLIDDEARKTLVSVTPTDLRAVKGAKTEQATALGKLLATRAKEKGVTTVVFDRGGYRFHGRIKALAEAARAEGLTF